MFNDTGLFGAFGGYLGGDPSNQIIDWSIGNTIPHSGSVTDDIVFSTSVGHFMTPANWKERMRITKEGRVGIGTNPSVDLHIQSDSFAMIKLWTFNNDSLSSELRIGGGRGSSSSPSPLLASDLIGVIGFSGQITTASSLVSARIQVFTRILLFFQSFLYLSK